MHLQEFFLPEELLDALLPPAIAPAELLFDDVDDVALVRDDTEFCILVICIFIDGVFSRICLCPTGIIV